MMIITPLIQVSGGHDLYHSIAVYDWTEHLMMLMLLSPIRMMIIIIRMMMTIRMMIMVPLSPHTGERGPRSLPQHRGLRFNRTPDEDEAAAADKNDD
jgi:hypothetical protein